MIKKIGIAVVGLVALLVAVIATRPSTYAIERSATVKAPPDVVYSSIVDFKKWEAWSPWAKLDPAQKTTYEGPEAAVGSSMSWSGNDKVGKGKMTITEVNAGKHVGIELEFIEPFASKAATAFELTPEGEGTKVTWAMKGNNDFMGKAMSLFMDMDEMVGSDFEKGLASMGTVAEQEAVKLAEAKKKAEEEAAAAAAAAAAANPEGAVAADAQ